tara:strand:- start:331 stop:783 length:453 start_codon:yes stop_codon:yes gene_type:complete
MSVSVTFQKSKTNGLILMILKNYERTEDYDAVIAQALAEGYLKTSKAKDPTNSTEKKETKSRGPRAYTAYQKWCRIFAVWEGIKIGRKAMKAIWDNYSQEQKDEWQKVAIELDNGTNIRDIPNKPDIIVPSVDPTSDAGSESAPESEPAE